MSNFINIRKLLLDFIPVIIIKESYFAKSTATPVGIGGEIISTKRTAFEGHTV